MVAEAMGIFYAPSALFLLGLGALLYLVYTLSLEVAEQRRQIRQLAQEIALLEADRPATRSASAAAGESR